MLVSFKLLVRQIFEEQMLVRFWFLESQIKRLVGLVVYGRIEVEHIEATFDSLIGELRQFL